MENQDVSRDELPLSHIGVPITCPQVQCKHYLSATEYSHEFLSSGRASTSASLSSQSENNCCVECPVCEKFVCVDCGVPWHASMSCEEFQILPVDERNPDDITLHRLARYKRWRRCQQCRIMIELSQGCTHMTCRCGHEFYYSCGAEYKEGALAHFGMMTKKIKKTQKRTTELHLPILDS